MTGETGVVQTYAVEMGAGRIDQFLRRDHDPAAAAQALRERGGDDDPRIMEPELVARAPPDLAQNGEAVAVVHQNAIPGAQRSEQGVQRGDRAVGGEDAVGHHDRGPPPRRAGSSANRASGAYAEIRIRAAGRIDQAWWARSSTNAMG